MDVSGWQWGFQLDDTPQQLVFGTESGPVPVSGLAVAELRQPDDLHYRLTAGEWAKQIETQPSFLWGDSR